MNVREQTRQNYDRMSRWYDSFASSERAFTEVGLELLNVQPGEKVLEIGFGTGHSLVTLARQAGTTGLVAGVDLSAGMIEVARKRMQAEGPERSAVLIQGDAIQLPFIDNSFEAVFLSFTLELFPPDEIPILLEEIQRVLDANGQLGVVSLQKQDTLACRLYEWGHERWPSMLDCRPIFVQATLEGAGFTTQKALTKTMWGLPVSIILAAKK